MMLAKKRHFCVGFPAKMVDSGQNLSGFQGKTVCKGQKSRNSNGGFGHSLKFEKIRRWSEFCLQVWADVRQLQKRICGALTQSRRGFAGRAFQILAKKIKLTLRFLRRFFKRAQNLLKIFCVIGNKHSEKLIFPGASLVTNSIFRVKKCGRH